jgi:hypothetical protein
VTIRAALLLFAFGAVFGSALDAIHTHSGTTVYPEPWILQMAWWTPLLFGLAGVGVGATYPAYERLTGRTLPRPRPSHAASAFVVFVLLWVVSGSCLRRTR